MIEFTASIIFPYSDTISKSRRGDHLGGNLGASENGRDFQGAFLHYYHRHHFFFYYSQRNVFKNWVWLSAFFYREHHFVLHQRCLGMGKMVYETTKWEGGFLSFLLFMISCIFTKVGEKRRERRRTSCVAFTSRSIIIIVNCIQHITLHYITLHCNDPLDFVQSEAISVTKRVQSILWA